MTLGTLWRYFFRRQLGTIALFTAGIFVLVVLIDFTEVSGRIPDDSTFTVLDTLSISLLRAPSIIETTYPFIILFASIATLVGLNRKYELVVARASGVSAWQFLAPLAIASLLVGGLVVTVLNPIAARTMQLSQLQEVKAGLKNSGDIGNTRPPWIRQETKEGTTIIGARTIADNGLLLANATFLRIGNDGNVEDRLDAERARLQHDEWVLTKVRRFRAGEPEEDHAEMTVATNLEPEFVQESLSDPKTIPFFKLPQKIAAARSFGINANVFAVQFHSLVALPFLMVSMTLIAAVVSLRFARFGQSVSVVVGGILAGFVLYVVSVVIKSFGGAGTIPPIAAAWIPVVVALALGITILLHKEDG
ncbi:LPS export ABC transporter permease LptG [Pararhizobium mangrovi]|uniref:LPS export ABC transporter permease LptG n=1 Tax=Pararhizobium mangrovi TaxID=2590452 RepID=A0A506UH26_9HYPH|nr:LPS export ABC transporter permease LptG [Pararhizobium mangrovi]TPW32047.1 LPS export ABC transporter permease LptG [Pararhizobium mangrovi]